jgi:hypothetical protein
MAEYPLTVASSGRPTKRTIAPSSFAAELLGDEWGRQGEDYQTPSAVPIRPKRMSDCRGLPRAEYRAETAVPWGYPEDQHDAVAEMCSR